jgi:high affinity Mn2+ porin
LRSLDQLFAQALSLRAADEAIVCENDDIVGPTWFFFRNYTMSAWRFSMAAAIAAVTLASTAVRLYAGDLPLGYPVKAQPVAQLYDWSGFYVGGHIGYAGGNSNWNAIPTQRGLPATAGSLDLYLSPDVFAEGGSFLEGLQAGYNHMLYNRLVIGGEIDASFPAWPNLNGIAIGGVSNFNSSVFGAASLSETVMSSGTVRGRIGYAPANWLFYATGGFAWAYNMQTLTQVASGTSETTGRWRFGWAAGAGIEIPLAPSWTARAEYLWTGYPNSTVNDPIGAQRIRSDFSEQQLRLGLNYQLNDPSPATFAAAKASPLAEIVSFHGQATFTYQGYDSFRSPYAGQNSLSGTGQSRETIDTTLFAGLKLWRGAEFWANPEIDQGFGLGNTHGAAGFPSGESYKLGANYPYARIQRAFLRQTIDLGGETEKVDEDINQFAGAHSTDRLVLTVGRFGVNDIFDTNKYANNPKTDFMNWSMINTGTFDYAGDAWGYSYGAAAEWYVGHWTVRAGIFDLSATPAGGNSPLAYGLDQTFQQFQLVTEIEERHELWGQPGKIKLTGFLSRGSAGNYNDAVGLAQATGQPADITLVRSYTSRPGISLNLEQQLTDSIGVFGRAGWASPSVEPWDFTDIDRTVQIGAAFSGKLWGRPDDTIGVAGVLNGISSQHLAFFNAGGIGILVGDGQLPHSGLEQIFETYYSFALTAATRFSLDYQFIGNPAYNTDRGPVNLFSGRFHWQF